jgi:hypothetical protein
MPALRLIGAQRAPTALLRVRKPDRRTETDDLRMELRAAGQEMVAAGLRIEYAIHADRSDVALHVAARLRVLGDGYANPDGQDAA